MSSARRTRVGPIHRLHREGEPAPAMPPTHRLVRCICGAVTTIRAHVAGTFRCSGCSKPQRLVR